MSDTNTLDLKHLDEGNKEIISKGLKNRIEDPSTNIDIDISSGRISISTNQEKLNAISFDIPESPIAKMEYGENTNPEYLMQQTSALMNDIGMTPQELEKIGQVVQEQELTGAAQEAKPVLGPATQSVVDRVAQQQLQQDGQEFQR